MGEVAPTRHVVGYLQQDSGDGGHGDERSVGHQEHQHQQQHRGVHHAGDGRAASAFHVGGGTRDGARGGDAAEPHRAHVADALRHQLHVAAVMAGNHGVGDHAR